MSKRILLTGASGFTGRHFIRLANDLGYECIALCHKPTDFVEGCVKVIFADLANKPNLKDELSQLKFDYVVHLAAISFIAHGDVADIYNTNIVGTVNLLDCLIELQLPLSKVLIASSGNVYGNNEQLPITESTQAMPVNDYAVSKYSLELAAKIRFEKLPIIIVRPFNYTGEGQAEHFLIPKIVTAFKQKKKSLDLGNLDVSRDFSDVRDVVSSYVKLLECSTRSDVYNICTGVSTSLLSVISMLNVFAGYKMEVNINPDFVRSNEVKELYGSCEKLTEVIGQHKKFSFQDTLKWMYES